jgi:CheY-like chemotaxis protein
LQCSLDCWSVTIFVRPVSVYVVRRIGLAAIFAQRPDVAVIDIGLPKIDGYEVVRRVQKQFSKSEIFLVALTGYGHEKDREAVFQAGFDEHFVKPVEIERLERALSRPRKPR